MTDGLSSVLHRSWFEYLAGAAAIIVVAAAVHVLSTPDPLEPGPGEARLEVDGLAEVIRSDGDKATTSGTMLLHPGDRVTAIDGSMRLVLHGGPVLEGRAGRNNQADTAVRIAVIPELLTGELLAQASDGVALTSAANEITLAPGAGAMRVTRSLAVEARSYSGWGTFNSAGQRRTIPAFRRLSVSVFGSPPARARPLLYSRADPWDRRFLGEIMELGDRLDAVATAYSRTVPASGTRTVGYFRDVVPALRATRQFTPDLIDPGRPTGETLVGAVITRFGDRGTFAERWRSVFAFRGEGASWGLVAADQQVASKPLLEAIEDALDASPFDFAVQLAREGLTLDELALGPSTSGDGAAMPSELAAGSSSTDGPASGVAAPGQGSPVSSGDASGAGEGDSPPSTSSASGSPSQTDASPSSSPAATAPSGSLPPPPDATQPTAPPVTATPTLPPATPLPTTQPPATQPPATLPPTTLPPTTLPPTTLPPVTLPPVTLPPATLPPTTLPPATVPTLPSLPVP